MQTRGDVLDFCPSPSRVPSPGSTATRAPGPPHPAHVVADTQCGKDTVPLLPARRALHHCRISLSRTEQIVYFGSALLQAVTSAVTPRMTHSNSNVADPREQVAPLRGCGTRSIWICSPNSPWSGQPLLLTSQSVPFSLRYLVTFIPS